MQEGLKIMSTNSVASAVRNPSQRRLRVYLENGSWVFVPRSFLAGFVGVDEYFNPIIRMTEEPFVGELHPISNCCGAFGKGFDNGVDEGYIGCRVCYQPVNGLGSTYTESQIYIKAQAPTHLEGHC